MRSGLGDTRLLHWFACAVFKVRREGAPALGLRTGRSLKTQQHAAPFPGTHRLRDPVVPACAHLQLRSTFRKPLELDDTVCAGGMSSRSNPGASLERR